MISLLNKSELCEHLFTLILTMSSVLAIKGKGLQDIFNCFHDRQIGQSFTALAKYDAQQKGSIKFLKEEFAFFDRSGFSTHEWVYFKVFGGKQKEPEKDLAATTSCNQSKRGKGLLGSIGRDVPLRLFTNNKLWHVKEGPTSIFMAKRPTPNFWLHFLQILKCSLAKTSNV